MQLSGKKALIITYYWPPSGGVGVQRWLKFVKYFRDYGWEPVVYTPENPESHFDDESLFADIPEGIEVIKSKIWEPYNIYKFLTGSRGKKMGIGFASQGKKKGFIHGLLVWLRGNLLIPDARIFWVKPSVKLLTKYILENPVDVIITTGPPQSMHLIGMKLSEKTGIPWVADFRDPWTKIFFYNDLKLGKIAHRINQKLERKVVYSADVILVVSEQMKREFLQLNPKRIEVITNGFDDEDLAENTNLFDKFTISHVGTINPSSNPQALWDALSGICLEDSSFKNDLRIHLAGQVDLKVLESVEKAGLNDNLVLQEYIPHPEALSIQRSSHILLLALSTSPSAKGILTGKIFEYLAARRAILGVGPVDGDLSRLIDGLNVGQMFDYSDNRGVKTFLLEKYQDYKSNSEMTSNADISEFSRRNLTGKIIKVIEQF
jgi:glycosyltransferase involved in cell wall biosynthesis